MWDTLNPGSPEHNLEASEPPMCGPKDPGNLFSALRGETQRKDVVSAQVEPCREGLGSSVGSLLQSDPISCRYDPGRPTPSGPPSPSFPEKSVLSAEKQVPNSQREAVPRFCGYPDAHKGVEWQKAVDTGVQLSCLAHTASVTS